MNAGFSLEEQTRLRGASALIIGTGGLGSPVAYQLAAAGVGRIGLCDMDTVDFSNLQRQVVHFTEDVGKPKVLSGAEKIRALNPAVTVETHTDALTSANALDLFARYDLILDCSDNFATRYLVNDASVLLGKPHVHGSIFRFDGQVTVFRPGAGPCYRCLYPSPPPPGAVPSCAQAGVIGVLPGLIGSMMAMEGLKVLAGRSGTLTGRLLIYNSLDLDFAEVRVRQNPNCPLCGTDPTIRELIDYEVFCGGVGE
ncbi:MAG TPA: ThiF family adenylyltransferase [Symbiobacteriaceae bacterium]|jgi:adenylyltransferase/sulfurtransferase